MMAPVSTPAGSTTSPTRLIGTSTTSRQHTSHPSGSADRRNAHKSAGRSVTGSSRNSARISSNGPSTVSSASTVSKLESLASSLPRELIGEILQFAAETSGGNSRTKLHLLCLSKHYRDRLAPLVYSTVVLCSSSTIHAFAGLVRSNPKVARFVRRVWIGPDDSQSDLITALSPPAYNEAAYITEMREQIHFSTRIILRSCRKLQDVALAGELLSLHAAFTYGSACQPMQLTSINPHSFVGGFSAPIFRKVKILRIVDTNLAFEEADEIRTLSELEWLIWSAPKDYGDITRDTNVLRRLLQRPRRHYVLPGSDVDEVGHDTPGGAEDPLRTDTVIIDGAATTMPQANEALINRASVAHTQQVPPDQQPNVIDALWTDLSSLELSEGLAPARPSRNDKFHRLTIQTAHNRCLEFRRLLADSYPLFVDPPSTAAAEVHGTSGHPGSDGLTAGLDASFADLGGEWDPVLNIPTIHPTPLAGVVLDEWDALRDLINNAGGQYTNLSMFDEGEQSAIVDAGNALRRQRKLWEQISDVGLPG
ncbi:hypothetical protein BCV70DRAFT_201145 [Testicularia cyperi]|uniref:Uncharacterized protein n=1 Tax=Testicularia cyperi TaxID=1882483 RepID=A0A317XM61_9BASI|nr:hypothetical protein BCV70DRAFT_201145 [Testicularia cyperi]